MCRLTGFPTVEDAQAGARAALQRQRQDVPLHKLAASAVKPVGCAGGDEQRQAAATAAAAAAAENQQHMQQQVQKKRTKQQQRSARRPNQKQRQQRRPKQMAAQLRKLLADGELDVEDSEASSEEGDDAVHELLAAAMSADQQLEQLQQQLQVQPAVLQGEGQQLHQEIQQLQAQMQMLLDRQQQQQLLLFAAATAASAAAANHVGMMVELSKHYNFRLPSGAYVRLGRKIAAGGSASAYEGSLAVYSDGVETVLGQVAVKVFVNKAGNAAPEREVLRELTALELLQWHPTVVKLVAFGVLQGPTAAAAGSAAAAAAAALAPPAYCMWRSWLNARCHVGCTTAQ
jgi:hypothetical protein